MTIIDGLTNTWDFKDRLVAVENAEMRADYTYDYTDRRIIKRVFPSNSPSRLGETVSGRRFPSTVTYTLNKYLKSASTTRRPNTSGTATPAWPASPAR